MPDDPIVLDWSLRTRWYTVRCDKCRWRGTYTSYKASRVGITTHIRHKHTPKPKPPKERWLTLKEAAEYLGLERQMILKLVKEGRMPHKRKGRRYLFAESVLYAAGIVREVLYTAIKNKGRPYGWPKGRPRKKPRDMSEVEPPPKYK